MRNERRVIDLTVNLVDLDFDSGLTLAVVFEGITLGISFEIRCIL